MNGSASPAASLEPLRTEHALFLASLRVTLNLPHRHPAAEWFYLRALVTEDCCDAALRDCSPEWVVHRRWRQAATDLVKFLTDAHSDYRPQLRRLIDSLGLEPLPPDQHPLAAKAYAELRRLHCLSQARDVAARIAADAFTCDDAAAFFKSLRQHGTAFKEFLSKHGIDTNGKAPTPDCGNAHVSGPAAVANHAAGQPAGAADRPAG